MARRYGSAAAFSVASNTIGLEPGAWASSGTSTIAGAAGQIRHAGESSRVYVTPAAYSEVRKVIFWANVRQEHVATALVNVPIRLRVAPSSSSTSSRVIISSLLTSSQIRATAGGASMWSPAFANITNENAYYDPNGRENTPDVLKFGTVDSAGSQLIYQEFDRFDATDAAFFNDWDSIAATGSLDRHVAYMMAVQRIDGGTWNNANNTAVNNNRPVIIGCGFAVVQAPAATNNTRMYLPATPEFGFSGAINIGFSADRANLFVYHADEWSGTFELRLRIKQFGASTNTGRIAIEINKVSQDSLTLTQIYTETFDIGSNQTQPIIARTANFANTLTDGDILVVRQRATQAVNNSVLHASWEITHRGFNTTALFFPCAMSAFQASDIPGTPPGASPTWEKAEGLFDPLWLEDMEQSRFLKSNIQGGLTHRNASNNSAHEININANLGDNVATSLFNAVIAPDISSTPNASTGYKLRDDPITSNDPKNLAGKRKLTLKYGGSNWLTATADDPGNMALRYVLNVPNSDVLPLGPLFDLGSFDAEGCAATSAGLGEPGVLVITNGSSIPKKFNPTAAGSDGEVEDAGIPTPFEGEVPATTVQDTAFSPAGGLELGTYKYRYTFRNCCTGKESDPNPDDITVDTTSASPAAEVHFSFAGVRIPGDPQICEICLYRTVEGGEFPIMAKVGCFNIDDGTTFVDQVNDASLDFTNDGLSLLNAPMPCVPIVVEFRNRLFGMGDIPNLVPAGTVSVVNGSDIVFGDGDVEWDRCLEGKFIQVGTDCRSYEILRVLPPEEGTSPPIARLKLVEEYGGTTGTDLDYHICGRPNRLYFSEPLEPEYWPAANFIDVDPGDGDRLMGAVSNFDSLVICKRSKSYVLRFSVNPATEIFVPSLISSDVGCIGPRSFAQIESGSVWLADRGLALYDGRSVMHVEESFFMNDIFVDPDNPNYVRRDRNGRVVDAVGVFYPKREQYLLLLPSKNSTRGCDMMLVWSYKLKAITLLKFCQEFQSMVVAKDTQGNERVYMGDTNGFVWIYDVGDTDGVGVPNGTGTVRGDVTFAGVQENTGASIMDSEGASFLPGGVPGIANLSGVPGLSGAFFDDQMGLAGVCLYTRLKGAAFDDPWTVRVVYAATATRLYVTPEWGPDVPFDPNGEFEWEFMLGPINMDWIFKPQNYGTDDTQKRTWKQVVVHEIEQFASKLRVRLLPDFQQSDPEEGTVIDPVTGDVGEGRVFAMDYSKGRQIKPIGRIIYNFMGVRMQNFAPEEPISLINHIMLAAPQAGK